MGVETYGLEGIVKKGTEVRENTKNDMKYGVVTNSINIQCREHTLGATEEMILAMASVKENND